MLTPQFGQTEAGVWHTMDEVKRLNLAVSRQLYRRIRIAAAANEQTVPALLKEAIARGLETIERQSTEAA
jgi:hypothetical protein